MNIANKLTILRILLIPFVVWLMLTGQGYVALGLFVFGVATDFFDGYLARKLMIVTNFGKFMDPVADKLLVLSALICFVELGQLPAVAAVVIVARELVISIFRAIAASENVVIAASNSGKIKTTVQYLMTVMLFLKITGIWMSVVIWGAVAITVYSGAEYIIKNKAVISDL